MNKRVDAKEKIVSTAICLRVRHLDFIDSNKEFNFNKFVRDQLDKYIKLRGQINELQTTN